MAKLQLTDVHHVYPNGHRGLRDINLSIEPGEFITLVGPSGSGKTTLLRTIAGFLQPSHGMVDIGGTRVADDKSWVGPERRDLGMVFQEHAVWPHLTVFQNVAYPLQRKRVAKTAITRQVADVLEEVGLSEHAQQKPAALSGGQRQRVALARAIVSKPQALLLDEALSALDEPLRARLRQQLRRLTQDEDLTTVHVTHDRTEALALADRVVVLNGGRIVQDAPPAEILANPANSFVAAFMSDAAVLQGSWAAGRFYPDNRNLHIADDAVVSHPEEQTSAVRCRTTVAPEDIRLETFRGNGPADRTVGTVTSVLAGRFGTEISVDWDGGTFDVYAPVGALVPKTSDRVVIHIDRMHVFEDSALTAHGAYA